MPRRPVRECIQRAEPLCARTEDSVFDAVSQMAEHCCSSILVCEEGRLRGIFTERDLLVRVVAAGLDPKQVKLGEVMTPDPDTVDGSTPVYEAIRRMDEFSYRHLPVMDGEKILGVVALRDLPMTELVAMAPEIEQRHTLAERMW